MSEIKKKKKGEQQRTTAKISPVLEGYGGEDNLRKEESALAK